MHRLIGVAILGVRDNVELVALMAAVGQVAETVAVGVEITHHLDYSHYYSVNGDDTSDIIVIQGGDAGTIPTLLRKGSAGRRIVVAYRRGAGTLVRRRGNLIRCELERGDENLTPFCDAMRGPLIEIGASAH